MTDRYKVLPLTDFEVEGFEKRRDEDCLEIYCHQRSYKLAEKIDDKMAIVVKPRPWYCPTWLYKKIIKDSVEICQKK